MIQLLKPGTICLIFLMYFFSTTILIAQNEEPSGANGLDNNSYLTTNILSPLNGWIPRWRIGYIRNVSERWKIGLDVGYGDGNVTFFDLGENYQLWEIRPEFYYFIRTGRKTKKYLSLEAFYINHKDIFFDQHYFPVNGESTRYDQADYHRQKYGMNLKFGFVFNPGTRLGLNLYTGLGFRIRKNVFSDIQNPRIVDVGPEGGDMFGLETYKNLEGTNLIPNFALGIKLYYRLNN